MSRPVIADKAEYLIEVGLEEGRVKPPACPLWIVALIASLVGKCLVLCILLVIVFGLMSDLVEIQVAGLGPGDRLPEHASRHGRKLTQLIGACGQQRHRQRMLQSVVGSRQPFVNLAGASIALNGRC